MSIGNILIANLDVHASQLSILSNVDLMNRFKQDFSVIGDYAPINAMDKTQVLEYSKVYIDEFKFRIANDSPGQLVEFAQKIQELMKADKTPNDSYYTRTLLRLYSYAIRVMKEKKIPDMLLKKDFL